MFSTRTWRLVALIAAIGLVNALVLPVLGQTEDPIVDVTVTDATAAEAGLDAGVLTLTRTGEVTSELAVDYTVTGTATAGDDYVALTGVATFAAGASTTAITVTPIDDTVVEGDETVILTLDANAAYTIGDDDQATITIEDNEPGVEVTASDATATEEGTTTGAFTFTRTGDLAAELVVDYTVTGTATAGDDYVALTGTATFAAGAATADAIVTPVDDSVVEGDETVILTLDANAAYFIGDDDQATVTIQDNDEAPTVEVTASDAIATEEGTTTGVFTFTRTGDLTDPLAIDYTVTGTATPGDDYVSLTGTATVAAGAATTNIVVLPNDDTDVEGDETVILTLDANAAYTIGDDDQATITIEDNDAAQLPIVEVMATDATATEEGTTTGAYTFTRTGDLGAALDVDYTVTGTATAGSDYVALSGTASFAAGAATTVVTVTPIDDAVDEGDETVIVTLDADAAYSIGDDDQATVTIADNDEADDDDGQQDPPALVIPFSMSDCKDGGWMDFGVFKNQGDCVSFVATKGKNPPALLGDMTVEEWLESLDS